MSDRGEVHVAFVCSSSTVAPHSATTMPRLELCAAVKAAMSATVIREELRVKMNQVHCYGDSMIVLGYLTNQQRRFSKYVTRRVGIVLTHTMAK